MKRMYETSVVSERLKRLRREKGVTQNDVVNATNISLASIKQYETGKRIPEKYNLDLLASYFRVEPDYILGANEYKNIFDKIDTNIGTDNLRELAWRVETIKRFSKYYEVNIDELSENQQEILDKRIKGFIQIMINSLTNNNKERKSMQTTEREYLIEGIQEELQACDDLELLYLIRSLLFESKE